MRVDPSVAPSLGRTEELALRSADVTTVRTPRRLWASLLAAVLLAASCGTTGNDADDTADVVASQSLEDATRDGVVPELAALPLEVRMEVVASARADDGVWVLSRPTAEATARSDGCRLGSPTGRYPTEVICTTEYGEVLLLDEDSSRILRAFPLPGVPPASLEVTDDTVYCARSGDPMLPDAMVCRIDTATFDHVVRVFPPESGSVVVQPCFYPPPQWTVDPASIEVAELVVDADAVWARDGSGTWSRLDPLTLEVTDTGLPGPVAPTTTTLPPGTSTTVPAGTSTTVPPQTSTTAPAEPTPPPSTPPASPTPTPVPTPGVLEMGDTGEEVASVQRRLIDLGYWISAASGTFGVETAHAVTALQKVAHLPRTGVLDADTRAALDAGTRPSPQSGSGRVVEISIALQVLMIVQDGHVEHVFDTSTGRPAFPTPTGRFTIYDEVDGWHDAGWGVVYRPKYFHEGLSIHAYPEVPPQPASHGCSRLIEPAMNWLWDHGNVPVGTPVWIN